jgi:hypothetical protein
MSAGENEGLVMLPEIVCHSIPDAAVEDAVRAAGTVGRGENAGIQIVIPIALSKDPKNPPARESQGDGHGI